MIHNSYGAEVEQCGNGARCFARFVFDTGLTNKERIRVQTQKGVIEPCLTPDGRVTVNMGAPVFALEKVPFDASGLTFQPQGAWGNWPQTLTNGAQEATVLIAPVSMGNPHGVIQVDNVNSAPVCTQGPQVQQSSRFPQGVNVGFLEVVDRGTIRLRVYERGVGETLACGSGACAAVVAGIRLGLLDPWVNVHTRGGLLTIGWAGGAEPVMMTGPATTVFRGEIEIPDNL